MERDLPSFSGRTMSNILRTQRQLRNKHQMFIGRVCKIELSQSSTSFLFISLSFNSQFLHSSCLAQKHRDRYVLTVFLINSIETAMFRTI